MIAVKSAGNYEMARYRKRAYTKVNNFYSRGKRTYRRAKNSRAGGILGIRGKMYITKNPLYYAGAAVGAFTDIDAKIPLKYKVLVATMPIGGGILQPVKEIARGCLFGDTVNDMLGGRIAKIGEPSGMGKSGGFV